MASTRTRGRSRIEGKGPFIYNDFRDNHVIGPAGNLISLNSFGNPSRA